MRTPISNTFFWFVRAAISLTVIITLLLGYKFLHEEFAKYEVIEAQQGVLRQFLEALERNSASFAKELTTHVPNAKSPANVVIQQVKWLENEINTRQQQRDQLWASDAIGRYNPVSPTFRKIAQLDIELALLNEALAHARNVHTFVSGPAEARRQTEWLSARSTQLGKQIYDNKYAQWRLSEDHRLLWQIPFTGPGQQMKRLVDDEHRLQQEKTQVDGEYARQLNVLKGLEKLPAPPLFQSNPQLTDPFLRKVSEKLEENDRQQEGSSLSKFLRPIRDMLPTATTILLLALLSPLLVKAIAYYLIAPVACRRPSIRVLEQCSGVISTVLPKGSPEPGETMPSRVSLPVTVGPRSELSIMPSYIHGMPANAPSTTRWLLDWSMPITSLFAGMYRLTCIRPAEDTHVTVSSATDPLAEFSLIEIPEGAALVLQPRTLVGVVQEKDSPLRITRHWRITQLKAWMTLQFRYIVFHGPATLVVKGCRGVRVEPAKAGRTVNQAATLGFSANLAYSVTRNETFWSYYFGERELFNDSWTGDGYCVHSETPETTGRSRLFGRGLEGILDTILKLFGI